MRATIFFLTFAMFIATVVWRVDQVVFGDKLAWGEAQSRAQMSALSQGLETQIQSLKDILILSFSEVELGKRDFSTQRPYSQFQMMSKLLPPNLKEDRKDWQVISTYFQENSPAKKWAAPYITLALKSVKESDVKNNSANMYSLMDPSRKPYLLLLVHGGANWYAGLLGSEVFQNMMDHQKGQKSTVFIVNFQGQALGHTTPEYVGSLLVEDPLVAEIMKASVGSGFGIFRNLKGESVQGLYEQIENTNLFAVITTPVVALTAGRQHVRWELILMGVGLGLIGLAYFILMDRDGERKVRRANPLPAMVAPAAPVSASVNSSSVNSNAEKMKAYTQVASSLSHELKQPLSSILGHTHLVGTQVSDEKVRVHLEKIELEARAARDVIQKLLIFAGEDKVETQKMGLETVVNKALKHVEGKIISKGIKLHKNIQSVPQFTMAGDLVAKAVENVLVNAIEAMDRAPKKDLNVELHADGTLIHLVIADTGEGISQFDLLKIFDPFFTTRSGAHVGLGLSTALGIFKEAFGEVHVDSEKGKGTTVTVVFNPQAQMLSESVSTLETVPETLAAPPAAPAAAAASESVAAPAVNPNPTYDDEKTVPISPLLVDNTIERLIEGELPDMPPLPEEVIAAESSEEPTEADLAEPPPSAPSAAEPERAPAFSSKIDKPKIDIKKKKSRLDEMQFSVRRPGDRA